MQVLMKPFLDLYEQHFTLSIYHVDFLGTETKQNVDFQNPTTLFSTL